MHVENREIKAVCLLRFHYVYFTFFSHSFPPCLTLPWWGHQADASLSPTTQLLCALSTPQGFPSLYLVPPSPCYCTVPCLTTVGTPQTPVSLAQQPQQTLGMAVPIPLLAMNLPPRMP